MNVYDEELVDKIFDLIDAVGGDRETFDATLVKEMIQASLRTLIESHDTGQLKLISRSLKEMRYAYHVFNQYPGTRRVSIFGSARTPEDHPDYLAAKKFGRGMAEGGWMCITGAANGIMKAGLDGLPTDSGFGLSIRLPMEDTVNTLIEGDPKLITFRYFFVRKLIFMSHSDAVAAFPGGVGTHDEVFEAITLMQTGKANIIPVVLMEGEGRNYWEVWEKYVEGNLIGNGWVSPEDRYFWYRAPTVEDGLEHIKKFYSRFHSYRYVRDLMVIRIHTKISDEDLKKLNEEYSTLVASGEITQTSALKEEDDHPDLPRIVFHHTRKQFALLRKMIDSINNCE